MTGEARLQALQIINASPETPQEASAWFILSGSARSSTTACAPVTDNQPASDRAVYNPFGQSAKFQSHAASSRPPC
jgi:hypothetical protein